jgi:hypothetical protein
MELTTEQKTLVKMALAVHVLKTQVTDAEDEEETDADTHIPMHQKLEVVQRKYIADALMPDAPRIGHQSSDILYWLIKNRGLNGQEQSLCHEVNASGALGSLTDRLLGLVCTRPELWQAIANVFLLLSDDDTCHSSPLDIIAAKCADRLLLLGRVLRQEPRADPRNINASYRIFGIFEMLLTWAGETGKCQQKDLLSGLLCELLQHPGEVSPLFLVRANRMLLQSAERQVDCPVR